MEYDFLANSIDKDSVVLPQSDKINPFLLKNNYAEIIKALNFIESDEKFLYVHGFLGTGKRQFITYLQDFLSKEVIKLEYFCKESTVCDDILLKFTDIIDNLTISKAVNINAKITTLNVKFQQQISSIKKPFLIILHSLDDVTEENMQWITDFITNVLKENNVKLIVSTRALKPGTLSEIEEDRKIFLKAFTKDIFKEFLTSSGVSGSEQTIEDFYKYTRGYYYYAALSVKIIQAMKTNLAEFLQKFNQSDMSFDSYLGITYLNLIPTAIRNFFWFLRTIRHGISLNALATFEIYDEFSINYLKTNLMIFESNEVLYVQDYFLQKIDISIPEKVQARLHKYIISLYEGQLKEPLKTRVIMMSRQSLRAEIDYHSNCITDLDNNAQKSLEEFQPDIKGAESEETQDETTPKEITSQIEEAVQLAADKKYTEAIENFKKLLEREDIELRSVVEVRAYLARLYKEIGNYSASSHYYDLVKTYYKQHSEVINLNYLYYDMTDLYFKMYKHERAIETIKKVIYSVDTPQSLLVSACTLLGNIYSEINNPNEAYNYYKKALDSLNEDVEADTLAELYFKFALANDDRGDTKLAYDYYNKCISVAGQNPYKALAYSNLASCYYDNESFSEARHCFEKAYELDKDSNNYDGIYYDASYLAKICIKENSKKALDYLLEAKQSAEFINEAFYIIESSIALGDYYYNRRDYYKEGLKEYFKARKVAATSSEDIDISKIDRRINDMKLRMDSQDFDEIEKNYA